MGKHVKLTIPQKRELLSIKMGDKSAIMTFAQKVGDTYSRIYQHQWYMTRRKSRGKSIPITAYKLEKNTVIGRGNMMTPSAIEQRIKPILLTMGVRIHTLPVFRTDMSVIRKLFVDKELEGKSFGTVSIKDNPTMVRIYRKS